MKGYMLIESSRIIAVYNEELPGTIYRDDIPDDISHYRWDGTKFYYSDEVDTYDALLEEYFSIKSWFASTDYIPNKIVTNEWPNTDQRWLDYLAERLIKRQRQDELLAILHLQ